MSPPSRRAAGSAPACIGKRIVAAVLAACHAVHHSTSPLYPAHCVGHRSPDSTTNSDLLSRLLSCTADAQLFPAASQRPSSRPAAHPLTRIPTNATQHGGAGCSDFKHTSAARSGVHDRSRMPRLARPIMSMNSNAIARRPAILRVGVSEHSSRAVWIAVASARAGLTPGP
jgi:hypothetical protein